jgi:hypothetical protein
MKSDYYDTHERGGGGKLRKKKGKKTIGELTNSRQVWMMNPQTRVIHNMKGKGSYKRQMTKKVAW